jgi:hypothetical protein
MEQFPASSVNSWELIKEFIDNCDIYVVIIAGAYGSLNVDGISYTEAEFDYALSRGKRVLAFLHEDIATLPASKSESDPARQELLKAFRDKASTGRNRLTWSNKDNLAREVLRSLDAETSERGDGLSGWIRSDSLPIDLDQVKKAIYEPSKYLGIRSIHRHGSNNNEKIGQQLASSRLIKGMFTSGLQLVRAFDYQLIKALSAGAEIKLLLGLPGSRFVEVVGELEGGAVNPQVVDHDIRSVEQWLRGLLAKTEISPSHEFGASSRRGTIALGYHNGQFRSNLLMCDDRWGWMTLSLPPTRAQHSPSFELEWAGDECLLATCIKHFETVFSKSEDSHYLTPLQD